MRNKWSLHKQQYSEFHDQVCEFFIYISPGCRQSRSVRNRARATLPWRPLFCCNLERSQKRARCWLLWQSSFWYQSFLFPVQQGQCDAGRFCKSRCIDQLWCSEQVALLRASEDPNIKPKVYLCLYILQPKRRHFQQRQHQSIEKPHLQPAKLMQESWEAFSTPWTSGRWQTQGS